MKFLYNSLKLTDGNLFWYTSIHFCEKYFYLNEGEYFWLNKWLKTEILLFFESSEKVYGRDKKPILAGNIAILFSHKLYAIKLKNSVVMSFSMNLAKAESTASKKKVSDTIIVIKYSLIQTDFWAFAA